jgi:molybdopterin molybdotransferase
LDLLIIPVEYLLEKDGWCIVRDPYQPPEHGHIHEKGLDRRAGATLLTSGTQLNAVHLGILASIGADPVCVYVQPKVAVIATGNELVPVQVTPLAHQIRMSNVHALSALLTEKFGIQSIPHFHLPDDPQAIQDWMDALSPSFDILLFSGGVSKGKKDYLPEIWAKNGFSAVFHGIAQKPGKPMWLGRRGNTVLFGFPGNPVSTLVCAFVYLVPWLRKQQGCMQEHLPITLNLENVKTGAMTPLLPVNITGLTCEVLPYTSSGDFSGVNRMNGVVEYYPHQSLLWY